MKNAIKMVATTAATAAVVVVTALSYVRLLAVIPAAPLAVKVAALASTLVLGAVGVVAAGLYAATLVDAAAERLNARPPQAVRRRT